MSKLFSYAELDPMAADYFDDGSTTVMGLCWLEGEEPGEIDGYGFLLTVDTEGAFVRFDSDCPIGLCFEAAESEILEMLKDEVDFLKGRLLLRLAKEKEENTQLIVYDNTQWWVKKMTLKAFIDEFSSKANTPYGIQNEYQYDSEGQFIFRWMSGKKDVVVEKIDPLKALALLAEFANDDGSLNGVYGYENPRDAIYALEWEIREMWDIPEYVDSCKKMLDEVKALAW